MNQISKDDIAQLGLDQDAATHARTSKILNNL